MNIRADILRSARVAARVTHRRAALAAGVSMTTIERLEATGDATFIALGSLAGLAECVGLTVSDLLEAQARTAAPQGSIDESLLVEVGAALLAHQQPVPDIVLAEASSVSPAVLDYHLAELHERLLSTGIAVVRRDGCSSLAALPRQQLTQETITTLCRTRTTRTMISKADARFLYAALNGATEKALRADANGHLRTGRLINAGLLVGPEKQNQPMELSAAVKYSLGIE